MTRGRPTASLALPVVRIVRADSGGWYVVAEKIGRLCGDRRQALAEKAGLDRLWGRA